MYPNTSDGNMATNQSDTGIGSVSGAVSQEDSDMINKVKEYIDRGINALVNQSKLHDEVAQLRQGLAAMQEQIGKVRRQNDWLDEQLVRIRSERDDAIRKCNEAQDASYKASQSEANLQSQLDLAKTELGKDHDLMEQLKKERDDAQYTALQLEEELAKVRAKVEKFLKVADEIDPPMEQPKVLQVPITQSWDAPKPVEVEKEWDPISMTYKEKIPF